MAFSLYLSFLESMVKVWKTVQKCFEIIYKYAIVSKILNIFFKFLLSSLIWLKCKNCGVNWVCVNLKTKCGNSHVIFYPDTTLSWRFEQTILKDENNFNSVFRQRRQRQGWLRMEPLRSDWLQQIRLYSPLRRRRNVGATCCIFCWWLEGTSFTRGAKNINIFISRKPYG